MKITKNNNIIKNNKEENQVKINNEKNNSSLKKNTFSTFQNLYPKDNTNDQIENYNNFSNNESNIIANILETNKIKNDLYKDEEFQNKNIKNNRKISTEKMLIYNEYKQPGNFSFINISEKVIPFLYQQKQSKEYSSHAFNNFKFLDMNDSYKIIINILIDDDSLNSSNNLSKIFESLLSSLKDLYEIKINNKDFLVCIFFQHFFYEQTFQEIFPGLNFYNCNNWNLKISNFYISYGNVLSINDTPINTLLFYKESSTFVQIYKFFYCYVLNDLMNLINIDSKENSKTFLLINWPNGKNFSKTSNIYHKSRNISNIIRISNNRNIVLIPDIDYIPNNDNDFFGYLNKYNLNSDKVETNLLWEMICGYPIDHRFFFINMNYKLYSLLKDFYQNNKIDIYSNPYYHNYYLSLYLRDNMKNIIIQKIEQVKIQYNDLPFNIIDFFNDYILRKGSYYANFFNLIPYFFSWKNMTCMKFIQKICIFFQLLIFIFQFFWLGLSFLVFYSVFNDTFGSDGNKMDYFGSLGYIIIIIILLFISLLYVSNKPKIKKNKINRNYQRNEDSYSIIVVIYFIHYLYFCFFIICAIIAIIHIKQGKYQEITDDDYYIFNTNYFLIILIVNILLYIIPSFLRPTNLIFKGFIFYLLFQLPNATCFFHLPYIFTCVRNISSKKKKSESLYITIYILFNGLLTIFCLVFDTTRQRRMDFLFILTIIYTILSGSKLIILVFGFGIQNNFNKNISTGEIPQYNLSCDECNDIINNNNIKSMNSNLNNLNFKKNKSVKNEKIIKKENIIKNHEKKKDSSQLDLNENNQNNNLNKNKSSVYNDFINNEDKRSNLSNKINLRNNKIESEFDKTKVNEYNKKSNLSKSLNFENSNSSIGKINNGINNNQENSINKNKYPMDSQENNLQENIKDNYNNENYNNENYNNNNYLNYSNRKSDNYPVDNIEPFSLKDDNNNINDINYNINNISSTDVANSQITN